MHPILSAIDVKLVGDGFGWGDLLIPGLALVGGLAGVLIGGWINRATLSAVEDKRGDRELEAERRRARGAAIVLHRELTRRALLLERLEADGVMPRPASPTLSLDLNPDDQTLLATWLTDKAWGHVSEASALLDHLEWDCPVGTAIRHVDPEQVQDALGTIKDASGVLEDETIPALSSNT